MSYPSPEWTREQPEIPSGSDFLLYRAAQNGAYGQVHAFSSGSITDALFVYLNGSPDPESIRALGEAFRGRPLVPLTESWRQHIQSAHPGVRVYHRYAMKSARQFRLDQPVSLPDGFRIAPFDGAAFDLHPFSHGLNYPSYADFRQNGAGAVVLHDGNIAASASSFLSFQGEVELDVSTAEAYRGRGLASACVAAMLKDCAERGLTVHWDAQHEISRRLAEKFGFELACCYAVYILPKE